MFHADAYQPAAPLVDLGATVVVDGVLRPAASLLRIGQAKGTADALDQRASHLFRARVGVGMVTARAPRSLTRGHPRAVLAAFAMITLLLGAAAPFTRWDANPDLLTVEGSPELAAYRDYLAAFGSDELLVIAFEHPDLLGAKGLATIRALTVELLAVDGVEDVSSLDTAYAIAFGPFGPFTESLLPNDLGAAPPPAELLAQARALPMARDGLVDTAGRTTALIVKPRASGIGADARATQRRALEGVDAVLARPEFAGIEFHLAGSPVFNRELERLNARDNALFTPVAAGLVAVLLALALRGVVVAALAMACVGGTVAWVRGAMTLLDVPLNTTTSLLAPLLMVLSVCVVLHVLVRYQRERGRARRRPPPSTRSRATSYCPPRSPRPPR